jgi:hypothetical protein
MAYYTIPEQKHRSRKLPLKVYPLILKGGGGVHRLRVLTELTKPDVSMRQSKSTLRNLTMNLAAGGFLTLDFKLYCRAIETKMARQ